MSMLPEPHDHAVQSPIVGLLRRIPPNYKADVPEDNGWYGYMAIGSHAHAAADYIERLEKKIMEARSLLQKVAGQELGIHRPNDLTKDEYYVSWDDGEYYIKKALEALK